MSCRNPHKGGRAYLKHQALGYLSRGWQQAVQPSLSDPLPVRFAFLLGARTHLPALLSTSPPPQPNSEPTFSSSLQVFAKAHLFFPRSSVFGLLLHSCSPLIRCSTPSKSAPEEGGGRGERRGALGSAVLPFLSKQHTWTFSLLPSISFSLLQSSKPQCQLLHFSGLSWLLCC